MNIYEALLRTKFIKKIKDIFRRILKEEVWLNQEYSINSVIWRHLGQRIRSQDKNFLTFPYTHF